MKNSLRSLALASAVSLFTVAGSNAAVVELGLGNAYTWSGLPGSGTTPWLTAKFEDVGANTVNLTLSAPNLTSSEFVSKWLFNLNPALDPSDLVVTKIAQTGTFSAPSVSQTDQNAQSAGGGLLFDFEFGFATSGSGGGANRFTDGDSVTFQITGISGLDVSDFMYTSQKDSFGPFTTVAHIQGISGGASAWIGDGGVPVPEPATVVAGCLLVGVLALRERSRIRIAFSKLTA